MGVLGAILVAWAGAGTTGAGGSPCRWKVVLDAAGPELSGVAALTNRNVWAVGNDDVRGTILHWNGHTWRAVPSPFLPFDIDAASPKDIWAVGSSAVGGLQTRPRAEHWNGRRWKTVPAPSGPGSYLRAVAALSAGSVWAVGAKERGPLVEHWNGSVWKRVTGGPRDGLLQGIDALSSRDVWAVGAQGMTTLGPRSEDSLVERLQAGRWRSLPALEVDYLDDRLLAVSAVSSTDVWAVGSVDEPDRAPLVEHWDGLTWRSVSSTELPETWASLSAVAAFGSDDVWVAGSQGLGKRERVLLAHWNGDVWSQVPGPRGGLADLAARSSRDIWAVGGSLSGEGKSRALVEHYSCATA
jgi:hypothetical protein